MAPWLLALAFGVKRTLVTPPPFTANATWPAPTTTSSLATLVGKGGAGHPDSDTFSYNFIVTRLSQRRGDSVIVSQVIQTSTGNPGTAPGDFCAPFTLTPGDPTYVGFTDCTDYTQFSDTSPATTGPAATGFGKTFPGGTGGGAASVTFNDVAITPGASYNLVIPAGGSITITYYQ